MPHMEPIGNSKVRVAGAIYWMEDLEREGLTYGQLLGFLSDCGVKCVCSPIHNQDKYTEEDVRKWRKRNQDKLDPLTAEILSEFDETAPKIGDSKKPHVHMYLTAKGPKGGKGWSEIFEDFYPIAPNRFVKVPDWEWAVNYCCHRNVPEKYQYNVYDVKGFGGADLSPLLSSNKNNKLVTLNEINQAIVQYNIPNFYRLNKWAFETGDADVISCVTGRASYFIGVFNSKRQELQDLIAKREREEKKREARKAASS